MGDSWRQLRVGDQVRLLCVPESDLRQRERELLDRAEMAGSTADALEKIIALDPVVTISEVDEYGAPWFSCELTAADGQSEYHSLTITDDESWERVDEAN